MALNLLEAVNRDDENSGAFFTGQAGREVAAQEFDAGIHTLVVDPDEQGGAAFAEKSACRSDPCHAEVFGCQGMDDRFDIIISYNGDNHFHG
jgi:hypothetical protein